MTHGRSLIADLANNFGAVLMNRIGQTNVIARSGSARDALPIGKPSRRCDRVAMAVAAGRVCGGLKTRCNP